ncbi:MAG: 50S ribosomal protein L23 [Bacteroidales bacterium]|nr:50S ribosomal protein L23 [Bacteroidales bacterium]NLK81867.1 50S ribosomal protein L23 [Bacteroidales bacterium]
MNIIHKPLISEKMSAKSEALNQYGFIVEKTAKKSQIKDAVEQKYGVKVLFVNTMRYAGKIKTRYTRGGVVSGKTNSFKKAIVSLKEGDQIDFFSNI